jgi:site-specific recombinase XerC
LAEIAGPDPLNLPARAFLLTGLKVEDIDLPSMSIRVLGKGRRERTLPLWKTAAIALRSWLAIRGKPRCPRCSSTPEEGR